MPGAAEISVDLKRRVSVKHVGIGALLAQQQTQYAIGVFGVAQPGLQIDPPRDRPTSRKITAQLERTAHHRRQFRRLTHADLVARIEAIAMRDVAVGAFWGGHVPIFKPLLQLSRLPHLVGRQAGARRGTPANNSSRY